MPTKPAITSIPTSRAATALLVAAGRACAVDVVLASVLDAVDTAERVGDLVVTEVARVRLRRLVLAAASKTIEIRRELEDILALQ